MKAKLANRYAKDFWNIRNSTHVVMSDIEKLYAKVTDQAKLGFVVLTIDVDDLPDYINWKAHQVFGTSAFHTDDAIGIMKQRRELFDKLLTNDGYCLQYSSVDKHFIVWEKLTIGWSHA